MLFLLKTNGYKLSARQVSTLRCGLLMIRAGRTYFKCKGKLLSKPPFLTTCHEKSKVTASNHRNTMMKTMTVGELKAHFSEVLDQLGKNGEPVAISYGKKKEKIAAIIPYSQLKPQTERQLGVMQGKASYVIHEDFALSDEEMLNA